jgi:hypothetical protein
MPAGSWVEKSASIPFIWIAHHDCFVVATKSKVQQHLLIERLKKPRKYYLLHSDQKFLASSAYGSQFPLEQQRSSKSLLAEPTGRKPATTGVARQDDELRKVMTSALRVFDHARNEDAVEVERPPAG